MAASVLYLDTARLGQTSPSALQAQIDFSRLTAEQPSSLYTDRFLADGIEVAPSSWRERFSGLRHWQGIDELKRAIKEVANAPASHEVAVASRSTVLMRLAARAMFRVCRNVLATDMSWPAYQDELASASVRANKHLTIHSCREDIFAGHLSSREIISAIAIAYERHGCNGLFLPLVDNLGVRLPVLQIIRAIEGIRKPRFVIIDGAQALGHLPEIDCHDSCDVFLAGTHKWMRAGSPLGIAVFGRPRSQELLSRCLNPTSRTFDDPLARFACSLSGGAMERYSETVNVAPLFACRAAITDVPEQNGQKSQHWLNQLLSREDVASMAESVGWYTPPLDVDSRTGILLLKPISRQARSVLNDSMRKCFADCGIAVSTYDDATIRMSMPKRRLVASELLQIETTLSKLGNECELKV